MADFEKSIKDLETIIEKLSTGDLSLKESVDLYEKGVKLSKSMEKQLNENEKKISIILEDKEQDFDNSKQKEKAKQMTLGESTDGEL